MNTSTKYRFITLGIFLISFVLLSSCAQSSASGNLIIDEPYGFWYGLWHGIITPISFVISLFNDDVVIYGSYNNGAWYDVGFLFGIAMTFGGSGSGAKRCK